MTKPKSRTISAPYDARHVGGVSVQGATNPIVSIERSSASLEPDETPSHTFAAHGFTEVPRRSNTIATALNRPSLRLKTSIARIRGRSSSSSPDRYRGNNRQELESTDAHMQVDMPVQSLRKKTSTSRFWHKAHQEISIGAPFQTDFEPTDSSTEEAKKTNDSSLRQEYSLSRIRSGISTNPYVYHAPPPPPPPPPKTLEARSLPAKMVSSYNKPPIMRPKRADSGTAIDFDGVPVDERPLGFKEILSVSSLAERMALYQKTRNYWAHADHGLDEWVARAGQLTFRV